MRPILATVVVAVALAAPTTAASPPTKNPGRLTVGLAMPSAGFQVGAVRGRTVVLAKGLEIDLAHELARRLGISRVRFVNESLHSTLLNAGRKDWDIALAQISITPARAKRVDFSKPYLVADQGVLVRSGLPTKPTSLADLRKLKLCAERATTGAQASRTGSSRRRNRCSCATLRTSVRALHDALRHDRLRAPSLAVLRRQAPDRYGPLVGRIVTKEKYAIALEKGSPLRPQINAALRAVIKNGTLTRLRRRWLGIDTATLPSLR